MRLLHRIIMAGVIVLGAVTPGLANLCIERVEDERLTRFDVVFAGKLLDRSGINKEAFEVQRVIKGDVSGTIEVDTSHMCDLDIFLGGQGRTYIVYAQKHHGMLSLESCSGTRQTEVSKIQLAPRCDDYERPPSLWEKMLITTICVSLSLSLGYLVNIARKGFR